MCAQFLLKAKARELENLFGIKMPEGAHDFDERILPYRQSPVITHSGVRMMNFSLIPSWSKERKPKFATHNARLETIAEKPTWKKPFETKHCLIPLTTFIEPIYENEFAGHMVGFHTKDSALLAAAGVYDEWLDKETGEIVESFAIITDEPPPFIAKIGHDRCPVFLPPPSFQKWLEPKPQKGPALVEFLKHEKYTPQLTADKDRPMRPGWQKRI